MASVFGLLGDENQENNSENKFLGMDYKTVRTIGIGLLVTGVALGGYAVYKNASKKKSGKLSGVKRRKSVKGGKRRATKRVTKRTVVKRINF